MVPFLYILIISFINSCSSAIPLLSVLSLEGIGLSRRLGLKWILKSHHPHPYPVKPKTSGRNPYPGI